MTKANLHELARRGAAARIKELEADSAQCNLGGGDQVDSTTAQATPEDVGGGQKEDQRGAEEAMGGAEEGATGITRSLLRRNRPTSSSTNETIVAADGYGDRRVWVDAGT